MLRLVLWGGEGCFVTRIRPREVGRAVGALILPCARHLLDQVRTVDFDESREVMVTGDHLDVGELRRRVDIQDSIRGSPIAITALDAQHHRPGQLTLFDVERRALEAGVEAVRGGEANTVGQREASGGVVLIRVARRVDLHEVHTAVHRVWVRTGRSTVIRVVGTVVGTAPIIGIVGVGAIPSPVSVRVIRARVRIATVIGMLEAVVFVDPRHVGRLTTVLFDSTTSESDENQRERPTKGPQLFQHGAHETSSGL